MRVAQSLTVAKPAAVVFPWLLDADKVPRWTSDLERYEPLDPAPLKVGSRVQEVLVVSGQRLDTQLEIVRFDPPRGAESTFELQGITARNVYTLEERSGQTTVTHAIEAEMGGMKGRMLARVIEPRLKAKLERDLAKLGQVLAAE